jgi:spermidine/putrescine ABC transporter ATP-binding subunit
MATLDLVAALTLHGKREARMPGRGAVHLVDLRKSYGEFQAVDGVSLDVRPGEFVTLLGPSGSGKTTTLLMIAGFAVPDAGDVLIDDRSVVRQPPHRRNVGMVFQNYALFPHMTVADNIAYPLSVRRWDRRRIAERVTWALGLVRLEGTGDRYPRQLSGGQQQRVALVRALVFEPAVLLMDEPLGALDRKLRLQMQIEIKRLQTRLGLTVVYVTHDQEEALIMSDRIAVMNHGRLVQVGTPVELYNTPASYFVADFVGDSNFLAGTVTEAGADHAIVETAGKLRLPVRATAPVAPGTRVRVSLRPEKIALEPGAHPRGLPGTVDEAVYMGEVTRYAVRVADEETLLVKVQTRHGAPAYGPGAAVKLEWRPEDALLFLENEEDAT